jgi:glycerol-3-phosphate dehydrogenase (NAD(P)+)
MLNIGRQITVIGGGAWGLAIAKLLAENGNHVSLWEYNPDYVDLINATHTNPLLLKDVLIPESIKVTNVIEDSFSINTEYIIFAIPSQFLRQSVKNTASAIASLHALKGIINVAKGVEENTLKRMSEVLGEELPSNLHSMIMSLSGPSHAEEVARKVPTAVVVAGENEALLKEVQQLFSNEYFRVYRSHDLIGVEIGGAVKNIISIAAGIIDGIGYGDNTKGALLTRGIVEIQRLGIALGANPETFLGLSGMGDLITTAISPHSRNRFVGFEIGRGEKLANILMSMNAVAEGVATTRSIYDLKSKLSVDMPITDQIHEVLFKNKAPHDAIIQLMTRSLKEEI